MGKFYGSIGFASQEKTAPGVYSEVITEREYFGESLGFSRSLQQSGQVNDNINVQNKLSILADPFANENFCSMRYVVFCGAKWKISEVSVEYPRLVLTIGGLYNG